MLESEGLMPRLAKMQKSKFDEFLGKVNLRSNISAAKTWKV